jgi:hypothetical protein
MNTSYITVPPDSTGKNVRHVERVDLRLTSTSIDLSLIDIGDVITGESSGFTGVFVGWSTEIITTYLHLTDTTGVFTAAENLQWGGSNFAVFASEVTAYTPVVNVADPNNASYRQKVDNNGSSYVRFTEGNLPFDAFGHAQFTSPRVIDEHLFTYGSNFDHYTDTTLFGGQVTAISSQSLVRLSVNTTSGSLASKTTVHYYPYTAAVGTELVMSVHIGDTGKDGVIRRWGLFDIDDGVFFQLSGSAFGVGVMNSIDNTENIIARSSFNGDSLDSATTSEFVLDVSKLNIYFLDFEGMGAGRVRFGSLSPSGRRTIIHTIENANTHVYPYMKRGTLPFKIQQFNETTSASTSEMSLVCASVIKQSSSERYRGNEFSKVTGRVRITGSNYTPILSFQMKDTFYGENNKVVTFPERYQVDVSGSSIELAIVNDGVLTGSTFSATTSSNSAMNIDLDATTYNGGISNDSVLYSHGTETFTFPVDSISNSLNNGEDGTRPIHTLAAKTLDVSGSADITLNFRWKEVR